MGEQVILASKSPRRRELLEKLGFTVKVVPHNIAEVPLKDESPENFVKRISREKVLLTLSVEFYHAL
jgi:septum formation protein